MSDEAIAGVGTREHVALKLLEAIAQAESKASLVTAGVSWDSGADKDWILNTYAECLVTVEYPSKRLEG